jgi:hypothetical protein
MMMTDAGLKQKQNNFHFSFYPCGFAVSAFEILSLVLMNLA